MSDGFAYEADAGHNTQTPVPKTKPKGKVDVRKHGNLYIPKKAEDIIVCPECGCTDIKEHGDSPRKIEEDGCVVDKTTIIHGYKCKSCNCEFNIKHTKRKIHRVQGVVGFLFALVCWIALVIALTWNTLYLQFPKDAVGLKFLTAFYTSVKYCLPSIIGLCCVDHAEVIDSM